VNIIEFDDESSLNDERRLAEIMACDKHLLDLHLAYPGRIGYRFSDYLAEESTSKVVDDKRESS
jgi:hypothetical protein